MKTQNPLLLLVLTIALTALVSCMENKPISGIYCNSRPQKNNYYQIEIFDDNTLSYTILNYRVDGNTKHLVNFHCFFFRYRQEGPNMYSLSPMPLNPNSLPVSISYTKTSQRGACTLELIGLDTNYRWQLANAESVFNVKDGTIIPLSAIDPQVGCRIVGIPNSKNKVCNSTIVSTTFHLSDGKNSCSVSLDKFHPYMAFYNPADSLLVKDMKCFFICDLSEVPVIEIGSYLLKKGNRPTMNIDSIFLMH